MKKLLIFFILFYLYGCSVLEDKTKESVNFECPRVFFSSENSVFIHPTDKEIDLEKVSYKASLNNYAYSENCTLEQNQYNFNINLLVIIEPFNPQNEEINLPLFVLIYNEENNLIDRQFFRITGKIDYDKNKSNYKITDLVTKINILLQKEKEASFFTIGFVKIK